MKLLIVRLRIVGSGMVVVGVEKEIVEINRIVLIFFFKMVMKGSRNMVYFFMVLLNYVFGFLDVFSGVLIVCVSFICYFFCIWFIFSRVIFMIVMMRVVKREKVFLQQYLLVCYLFLLMLQKVLIRVVVIIRQIRKLFNMLI